MCVFQSLRYVTKEEHQVEVKAEVEVEADHFQVEAAYKQLKQDSTIQLYNQ